MSHANNRRQQLKITILALAVLLILLGGLAFFLTQEPDPNLSTEPTQTDATQGTTQPTQTPTSQPTETTQPTTAPTEPPVVLSATVTLAATGDMLMHMPVVNRYYSNGSYNFDGIFTYLREYVTVADFAFANLETTLAGADFVHDSGNVGYSGYPQFNCPDSIIDGMKNAGFDIIMTANNHSYDTRTLGLNRTMEVISNRNLAHLGTQTSADAPDYMLVEKDGIKLGLFCYTYEDNASPDIKAPNGHTMKDTDAPLISTFNYQELPTFYAEIEQALAEMKSQGVDAFVIFIHWGDEYQLTHNSTQKAIAQKLCDLGIDVIIGGHPHVIQPVELLTSTTNAEHKTVCVYSLGNAVSNQRQGYLSSISTAHTEDGMLFSVTFAKYSDGTVILQDAALLPTWVSSNYTILPLDSNPETWQSRFGVTDGELAKMQASSTRTNDIVGAGMIQVKDYLKAHTAQIETLLNVSK